MNRLKIILLFGYIALFSNIIAQNKAVELTLTQTIEIAADSSLQAVRTKNVYQASYWEFLSFKAARLPSLNLKMTPFRYYRDIVSRYDSEKDIDIYRPQQSIYSSANLSVQQNFDLTGGTFFVDTELGFLRNFGDNTYTQYTTVPVRVGYSQALFGFNSFKWEKQIEPLKYKKAKQQYLYNREAISENVTDYFFSLAMAQSEYDMALENVHSSSSLYHFGKERHKIAAISQADLLTLELDALNAENTLKNADMSLKRAMFSLASYLNIGQETQIRLILPEISTDIQISEAEALEYAKDLNPNFIANLQTVLEAEREVDRTKKSSTFDASFSASIGFNQVANYFSDAYRDPLRQDILSMSLSIPLVDWGVRKGRANMAKSNLSAIQLSAKQEEVSLEQDVIMTVNDFNIQKDMILSAEKAMNLANMAYQNTKERFIIGKADMNSLTLSLNRQKEAQKNYILALNRYWKSYYKIRKLTLFDFEKKEPLSAIFERELIK